MNEGLLYLNPSLAASSQLFNELNRDTPLLERFIVSSSKLVTDVADRHDDLSGLVDNLATTTTAIGAEQAALADSIEQLPPFMRRANTTFLNLRAALDDLDPLVADSKPVAKKLRPFMAELRPLARDARPTLRDLAEILRRPGADNDALELTNLQRAAARRHGARRRGQRRQARGRVPGHAPRRCASYVPSSPPCARTRRTRSAGSTTSATPASTTRSAPPRASASTRARSRSPTASSRPCRRSCATRRSAPARRSTSATAARAPPSTRPTTAPTRGSPPSVDCDPSQMLPGK